MGQKLIDETGNKYGFLTVKDLTKDKNGRTAWLCECDCGNFKIVRGTDLRTGKITSCGRGCPLRNQRSGVFKDETGNRYGKLLVLKRSENSTDGKVKWLCRCDCGNEVEVRGTDLRNGKTQSCGCLAKENASNRQFKEETGNTYGFLTVLSLIEKSPKAIWKCQCRCGNIVNVRGIDLRNGNTKSCGCLLSWPEEEINYFLLDYNINFKRQYTFLDLKSDQGYKLRFDFAILNNNNQLLGLIEYQGEQHTTPIESWGGQEALEKRQKYDNIKYQYCQQHDIPILYLNKNNNIIEEIPIFIGKISSKENIYE